MNRIWQKLFRSALSTNAAEKSKLKEAGEIMSDIMALDEEQIHTMARLEAVRQKYDLACQRQREGSAYVSDRT